MPQSIILVGGFSASTYLRKTVQNFYGSIHENHFPSYKIEIRHPERDQFVSLFWIMADEISDAQ